MGRAFVCLLPDFIPVLFVTARFAFTVLANFVGIACTTPKQP
jgi:hypothetical protein